MEARRQLIRYAITGSYAIMIGAFYEVVFGWAWKESVDEIIPTARADAITTIGGAVAVGFVLYQLYSAFERPYKQLQLTIRSPRWVPAKLRKVADGRTLRLRFFGAVDVSGEVLHALHDLPMAERALRRAFGCGPNTLVCRGQARSDAQASDVQALDEGASLLNSVLNLTYSSGDGQIARSYAALEDIYHALGACYAALIAISLTAALDVVAIHGRAYLDHLGPSLAVTGLALLLIWGSHRVIKVNRRRRWLAMTDQLSKDLRAWALRHPQLLSQLAEETIRD
jgi:hypothetical protein